MIYMLLGMALWVVKVVAKPLLLLQKKPPPEPYKSPGPPKLAIKNCLLGSYMLGPAPESIRKNLGTIKIFDICPKVCLCFPIFVFNFDVRTPIFHVCSVPVRLWRTKQVQKKPRKISKNIRQNIKKLGTTSKT